MKNPKISNLLFLLSCLCLQSAFMCPCCPHVKHLWDGHRTAAKTDILCSTDPTLDQAVTISARLGSPCSASIIFLQSSFALSVANCLQRICHKFSSSTYFEREAATFSMNCKKGSLTPCCIVTIVALGMPAPLFLSVLSCQLADTAPAQGDPSEPVSEG